MTDHTALQIVCAANILLFGGLAWALVQIRYWKTRYGIEKEHREKRAEIDKDHIDKLHAALEESFDEHHKLMNNILIIQGLDPLPPRRKPDDRRQN